ncbi:hypothetical protein B4U79_18932 [Dinothrombium tinctorium]|uniref:Uncharacterized protein n=1 Tax=Dinothrombium tinctorium TaxID=1965070 RepID=A0A3S3PW02_9ACAR|nr:hypothetical protein B4U79_18932 [Dinothrombium tinctorium]
MSVFLSILIILLSSYFMICQEFESRRQEFCTYKSTTDAATQSDYSQQVVFVFSKDSFFEFDLIEGELIGARMIQDKWIELDNNIDAACTIKRNSDSSGGYIFIKGQTIWFYEGLKEPKLMNKLALSDYISKFGLFDVNQEIGCLTCFCIQTGSCKLIMVMKKTRHRALTCDLDGSFNLANCQLKMKLSAPSDMPSDLFDSVGECNALSIMNENKSPSSVLYIDDIDIHFWSGLNKRRRITNAELACNLENGTNKEKSLKEISEQDSDFVDIPLNETDEEKTSDAVVEDEKHFDSNLRIDHLVEVKKKVEKIPKKVQPMNLVFEKQNIGEICDQNKKAREMNAIKEARSEDTSMLPSLDVINAESGEQINQIENEKRGNEKIESNNCIDFGNKITEESIVPETRLEKEKQFEVVIGSAKENDISDQTSIDSLDLRNSPSICEANFSPYSNEEDQFSPFEQIVGEKWIEVDVDLQSETDSSVENDEV